MKQLSHESLTVYQRAIEFVAVATELTVNKKVTEGFGKHTGKDQARFYDIARGSALECGACLDVLVAMKLANSSDIFARKQLLSEIVAMLTGLSRSVAADRTREEHEIYQS